MKNKPLILISLDGMSVELTDLIKNSGFFNYFDKFSFFNDCKKINSVLPPISGAAWSSFISGKNPINTGILDFVVMNKKGILEIINYNHLSRPTFLEILSQNNFKVASLFVPTTYPPPVINGMSVSGILSNNYAIEAYPQDLKINLNKKFKYVEYPSSLSFKNGNEKEFISKLINSLKYRFNIFNYIMNINTFDFIHLHIHETDILQHVFWKQILLKNNLNIYYFIKQLNDLLFKIISKYVDIYDFIIFSDHGFETTNKVVRPNQILFNNNILKLNNEYDITYKNNVAIRNFKFKNHLDFINHDIDKENSLAYCYSAQKTLLINLKRQNHQQNRKKIIALFTKKYKFIDNFKIINNPYRTPNNVLLPDIIFYLKPHWFSEITLGHKNEIEHIKNTKMLIGGHNSYGIINTNSKLWKKKLNSTIEFEFMDICSSILDYYDIKINNCYDGNSLFMKYNNENIPNIVEKRLKSLGYL